QGAGGVVRGAVRGRLAGRRQLVPGEPVAQRHAGDHPHPGPVPLGVRPGDDAAGGDRDRGRHQAHRQRGGQDRPRDVRRVRAGRAGGDLSERVGGAGGVRLHLHGRVQPGRGVRRPDRHAGGGLPARGLLQRGGRGLGRHRALGGQDGLPGARGDRGAAGAVHRHGGGVHHDRRGDGGERRVQQPGVPGPDRQPQGRRAHLARIRRGHQLVPVRPFHRRLPVRLLHDDLVVVLRRAVLGLALWRRVVGHLPGALPPVRVPGLHHHLQQRARLRRPDDPGDGLSQHAGIVLPGGPGEARAGRILGEEAGRAAGAPRL
ncbi:MAG: Na(+)-linked D-alanine glycine permease, partial [uncultured Gemmatimonadetes bacterium]